MLKATAVIREDAREITVDVIWSGEPLDRPHTGGFGLKLSHRALALRLKRAIDAQAVHVNPGVVKDVNGKSYVQADCRVLGRHMNADLRRIGY